MLGPNALIAVLFWKAAVSGLSLDVRSEGVKKADRSRRDVLQGVVRGASLLGAGSSRPRPSRAEASSTDSLPHLAPEYYLPSESREQAGRSYFPALTPPFRNRATLRYALGRDTWALEQLLAFGNVTATVRTNVVRMRDGNSLWVHGPQYPTGEFRMLLNDLGTVRHVVLPCNALEHKAPLQDFLKWYPNASVWVAPGQYGPFGSCGTSFRDPIRMGYRVDGILLPDDKSDSGPTPPPWADEFDYETLYLDLPGNAGPVSEVAFFHKPSRTLLTVDAVVFVPPERPPQIFETYFDAAALQDPQFWPKTVLQSVFLPLRFERGNDGSARYPAFEAVKGRLLRAPILRALNDARAPDETRRWVDRFTDGRWDYDRIVTSHFAGPIALSSSSHLRDVRATFAHLDSTWAMQGRMPPLACRDWELLEGLNRIVAEQKLGAPVVEDYRGDCVPEER